VATRRTESRAGRKANQEFVSEAEEILERMREDYADLDDQRAAGRDVEPDLINRLFRSAHSLKALAGMFGLESIKELAHHLEDILDGLRLDRVSINSPAVSLIDEAIRIFASLLESVGDEEALAGLSELVEDLTSRIEATAKKDNSTDDVLQHLDIDSSLLRALTEYEEHRLRENIHRGRHITLVDSTFEIMSFEEGLSRLSEAVRAMGEVLSTLPAPGDTPESQIRFSLLVASDLSVTELAESLDLPGADVRSVRRAPALEEPAPLSVDVESVETTESDPIPIQSDSTSTQSDPTPTQSEMESLRSISDTVRVDIRKLDELMNLVGELVIQRVAVGDIAARLVAKPDTARIGNQLLKIHKSLDRKLKGMQSAVLEVRMIPMRQIFDKISRVVRTLRRDLNKSVRLEVSGSDTELDKLIVEELVDPLMHIVRNALDHAIERVDDRVAAGKNREGCIRIQAFQRGNHVVISVADDGKGIDRSALRARAESLGIVSSDDTLNDYETLSLMFAPGLSTQDQVSETSGRGVGMDVVRANVMALGGVVDVESILGRGTTISMTLPITLAIIQSLIVGVGSQRFAIPMNAVLETLLIDATEIQHSEGTNLLNLRGEALPLRDLATEFGIEAPAHGTKKFAVVVGMGDLRIGLLVDRLDGQQDTVIKPIQGPIKNVRGIAGATELGDQDPVLVIDVSSLVEDAVRRRDHE
jgi:two-component system chemotaxis sensor kinase CheA